MTLTPLFADGFDLYTTSASTGAPSLALWDSVGFNPAAGMGTSFGRFGSVGINAVSAGAGDTSFVKSLPAAPTVIGMGCAFKNVSNPGRNTFWLLRDGANTAQASLSLNVDGSLSVWRGDAGVLLGTSAPGTLPVGIYSHIEAQCKIDPAAGTWDVWVNGVCVLSLSGLNTRGSGVAGSGASSIVLRGNGGGVNTIYLDDFHCYDAAARTGASGAGTPASSTFEHYGDRRLQTLFPNGAGTGDVGTFTQVGGTGGSPWTAVNERPQNGDTSYLADGTPGDIKTLALDDLAAGTTGIVAVFPTLCLTKDDATSRQVAVGLRTSGSNTFAAAQGTPSTYAYQQSVMTTDGAGAALTPAGVNGSEIAIKIAA